MEFFKYCFDTQESLHLIEERCDKLNALLCCFTILSTETFGHRDGRIQGADQMYVEFRNGGV